MFCVIDLRSKDQVDTAMIRSTVSIEHRLAGTFSSYFLLFFDFTPFFSRTISVKAFSHWRAYALVQFDLIPYQHVRSTCYGF